MLPSRVRMGLGLALLAVTLGCAAPYKGLTKPTPNLGGVSGDLQSLSDAAIETYLKADMRPAFPTILAVAKVTDVREWTRDGWTSSARVEGIWGTEGQGWRALAESGSPTATLIEQVQTLSGLLVRPPATLKALRDGAAQLHAPLLLVYTQADDAQEGYNDAGMLYWTIIGLFCVPGHTVGHYTACQAVLVDTRTGFVLGTAEGEAHHEEVCLPGAVSIAADRTRTKSQSAAVQALQANVRQLLLDLSKRAAPAGPGSAGR